MQLPEILAELEALNYQAKRLSVKDPEHAEIHGEINEWIGMLEQEQASHHAVRA